MMDAKGPQDPSDLPDPDLKIILLGDSAVGKSKLIERYLMDEYNPRQVSVIWYIFEILYWCFHVVIHVRIDAIS